MALLPRLKRELGERANGVDESVLEYVAGVISDSAGETLDDIVGAVSPFLVDTGCLSDDAAVRAVVETVTRATTPEAAAAAAAASEASDRPLVQKLSAPVSMKTLAAPGDELSAWQDYIQRGDNPSYVDTKAVAKAEEKMRERAEKRAAKEAARVERQRERQGLAGHAFNYSGLLHGGAEGAADDGGMGRDIRAENLSVTFGKLVLLEGATLQISYGRRYGLVGRNGCGSACAHKIQSIKARSPPLNSRACWNTQSRRC